MIKANDLISLNMFVLPKHVNPEKTDYKCFQQKDNLLKREVGYKTFSRLSLFKTIV